mmetsp:Transcript_21108/g.24304  ORF Transcript_21108/g.24304 Transcript_21108/m.24304 type:complete len:99 (+) Transcript_21108:23-319(+)
MTQDGAHHVSYCADSEYFQVGEKIQFVLRICGRIAHLADAAHHSLDTSVENWVDNSILRDSRVHTSAVGSSSEDVGPNDSKCFASVHCTEGPDLGIYD